LKGKALKIEICKLVISILEFCLENVGISESSFLITSLILHFIIISLENSSGRKKIFSNSYQRSQLWEYKLLLKKIVLISNSHPRIQIFSKAITEESRKQRTGKKQISLSGLP